MRDRDVPRVAADRADGAAAAAVLARRAWLPWRLSP